MIKGKSLIRQHLEVHQKMEKQLQSKLYEARDILLHANTMFEKVIKLIELSEELKEIYTKYVKVEKN